MIQELILSMSVVT